jgi:hypothetical protein
MIMKMMLQGSLLLVYRITIKTGCENLEIHAARIMSSLVGYMDLNYIVKVFHPRPKTANMTTINKIKPKNPILKV